MANNYDETKLVVFHEKEVEVTPTTFAVGRVYAYDGGEKRIKILSRVTRRDGTKRTLKQFPPLTNADQVQQLAKLLNECSSFLRQKGGE